MGKETVMYCSTHHQYDFCWECEFDSQLAEVITGEILGEDSDA